MSEQTDITIFARTNYRGKEVPFGIKTDDRRRHMYLIGKTGMGKTTMMENMVIQDIRNGHGVAFLDPHGDSVQRILNCIPPERINDVIYFNPADLEYPVAFNILEAVDQKYKHLVASGLMGVFTKIWANMWSARMEYILNNTILALLDSPGNTLLGITRMYVDKKYRKKIVDNIKDPMVRSFWTDEYANYNEKYRTEAIAPIQNKVGQFLSSGIIRNIVGQPKSTIDLREIMDSRKILIMDLSKGKVGEDNSALLGAMIVTKLQLAAMSRTDIPEKERKDFYLYVDEFQNFATDSFATILSEARKYRLNLIVGHQYIAQLENDKNTKVRDAIFGNVGTIVTFRVGAADAEFLETEFDPVFTPNDLVNLPKYHVILKLMINGVASEPFSGITLAPNESYITDNSEKVIRVSRERFTNPVSVVEDKIARWMGDEFHQGTANLAAVGSAPLAEGRIMAEPLVQTPVVTQEPNLERASVFEKESEAYTDSGPVPAYAANGSLTESENKPEKPEDKGSLKYETLDALKANINMHKTEHPQGSDKVSSTLPGSLEHPQEISRSDSIIMTYKAPEEKQVVQERRQVEKTFGPSRRQNDFSGRKPIKSAKDRLLKPKPRLDKKENPIWHAVSRENAQKNEDISSKIGNAFGEIFASGTRSSVGHAANQPGMQNPKVQNDKSPETDPVNRKVLQPNKPVIFE